MADQQFCLRWNNHQSTLVSVFDSLLERGAMVDCTLAAEGQCLQAHKVVLSACSPYLETLLSQHYDKHPILLLKDIKFYELQAMMDYMYRGEVNVAQDKLGMFLKAAESLQIKGLSESGGSEPADSGGTGTVTNKRTTKSAPVTNLPRSAGSSLPVERRRPAPQVVDVASDASRDGSVSPSLRKRRRRVSASEETSASAANSTDGHDAAAPSVAGAEVAPAVPVNGSTDNNALGILSSLMDGSVENDNLRESGPSLSTSTTQQSSDRVREKVEPTSEVMIEPKAEYLDADEDVEDLTLDDNMDDSGMSNAGPSQRQGQGYQWHMGDQSTDEVFMAAQEAVGANRDAQGRPVSPWISFVTVGNTGGPADDDDYYSGNEHDYAGKPPRSSAMIMLNDYEEDSSNDGYSYPSTSGKRPKDSKDILTFEDVRNLENPGSSKAGSSKEDLLDKKISDWGRRPNRMKKRPVKLIGDQFDLPLKTVKTIRWKGDRPGLVHRPRPSRPSSLRNRERERGDFPCPDCGKLFAWRQNMVKHRRMECGKEPQFPCPHCVYRSKRRGDLNKHIVRMHIRSPRSLKKDVHHEDDDPYIEVC